MEDNKDITHEDNKDITPEDNEGENIQVEALADLISDRDKKIEELTQEVTKLKKSNTEMLLRINAGQKAETNVDETILNFCDTRRVGRPTRKE